MTSTKHTTQLRRSSSWLAIATVALLMAAGCGDSADEAAGVDETLPPATTSAPATTTTAPPTTTTTEPPATEVVQALLDEYYAAYNAGDVDGTLALLSTVREVNPVYLEYWVGTLGEQVESDCVESFKYPEGLKCTETYRDQLHGPAGATGGADLLYFAKDGLLKQLRDPDSFVFPGCKRARCPGSVITVDGPTPEWIYETFEADLFLWLEESYPDVAAAVGEPGRLHYFVHNAEATALVMPYVGEFVAQSADWGEPIGQGADLSAMTALEAVLANYEALNSHDPDVFEAFFGNPPDDPMRWFWAQGRKWVVDCVETENDDEVRCEGHMTDDFYTRAGAIFEFREVWTKSSDNLFWNTEWANASDHWAYHDFEEDFGAWMRATYPDDAAIAFPTNDMVHNAAASEVAMKHLDEFLEWSDKYPRDPDGRNRWGG